MIHQTKSFGHLGIATPILITIRWCVPSKVRNFRLLSLVLPIWNAWYMLEHPSKLEVYSLTHRIHVCYIYGNIYHQYTPNVSIYTIHGSYGLLWLGLIKKSPHFLMPRGMCPAMFDHRRTVQQGDPGSQALCNRNTLRTQSGFGEKHKVTSKKKPSGKHIKNYGKSPFLMGKLTINGHFQ